MGSPRSRLGRVPLRALRVEAPDVALEVALVLEARGAVWTLLLRLLAALNAQVRRQVALPAVGVAAARAREAGRLRPARRVAHIALLGLLDVHCVRCVQGPPGVGDPTCNKGERLRQHTPSHQDKRDSFSKAGTGLFVCVMRRKRWNQQQSWRTINAGCYYCRSMRVLQK